MCTSLKGRTLQQGKWSKRKYQAGEDREEEEEEGGGGVVGNKSSSTTALRPAKISKEITGTGRFGRRKIY